MTRIETVHGQLARLRRGYVIGRCVMWATGGAVVAAAALSVAACIDLLARFPAALCWGIWFCLVGVAGAAVWRTIRLARACVSDEAMAVLVERVLPGSRNHLINAVQLSRSLGGGQRFVEELLTESPLALEGVNSEQLYSQKPWTWIAWTAVFALLVGAGCMIASPRGAFHAFGRIAAPMAGLQPYTRTQLLSVNPGDATLKKGRALSVEVRIGGTIPDDARIVWQKEKGKDETVPLPLAGDRPGRSRIATVSGELKGVFYDSVYRVVAGDTRSRWYRIRVMNPPALENWEARVTPPDYTGLPAFALDAAAEDMTVPAGSSVILAGAASTRLTGALVLQEESVLGVRELDAERKFAVRFTTGDVGALRLKLTSEDEMEATTVLPLAVLPDQRPTVALVDTPNRVVASPDAQVPVTFKADDEYGLVEVGFERLLEEDAAEPVSVATPPEGVKTFAGRFLVDVRSFDARGGDTLRFRVWARDNGPGHYERLGRSPTITITVPVAEDRRKAKEDAVSGVKQNLMALVKMQRQNLRTTRQLSDLATLGKTVPPAALLDANTVQKTVRDMAGALLTDREALGDFAHTLAGLVNHEMRDVLEVFDEAHRSTPEHLPEALGRCVKLETRILALLTGIPTGLSREQQHQEKTDILAALQRIVAAQRENLKDSQQAQAANAGPDVAALLAEVEDNLANDLVSFADRCLVYMEERVEDEFAVQLRAVYDLLTDEEAYEKALMAAEALEQGNLPSGIQLEEEVMRTLMSALNILNQWRMKNAKRIVKEAADALRNAAESLEEMEKKQAKIAEVTRDLADRGEIDEDAREQLGRMDEEQEEMANLLEELAQDLYQFPELPVCNEVNSKMRQIFEDVEQTMDSENAPAIEIAVQKEDGLLDAIRETKERCEDVEMWLPDVPDNIVWNMESFDADEFPDMPLVPLPDELEDIVGELLDQASDIDAQSQDTTGNNMMADAEMGWGVADGPMPNFSAKGKTGNTRPNDNEMTGRSGAGREGQSSGELVENRVHGMEGRKTHARRTNDGFQQGMVEEDENSTMDARATGGGKLGGESESIGMFGMAPRRDLHTAGHGMAPTKLRQETEAIYATARLLYLGTGSLGTAARELRGIEEAAGKMRDFGSLHRRVLRRLEDTQVELDNGVVLPMPTATVSKSGGAATADVDMDRISEEYRDVVSDYYRSLNER